MDYDRAKNVVVAGWVLVILSLILNVLSWLVMHDGQIGFEIFGIVLAVVALGSAYVHDSMVLTNAYANQAEKLGPVDKIRQKMGFNVLLLIHLVSMVSTVLSFVAWLISVSSF